jgi:hypothetical protein
MQDNTDVYARLGTDPVTAMSPSSMAGGNRVSDSARQTMTAPGSDPVDPMPPQDMLGDPAITAVAYGRTTVQHGGAPRPDPWENVAGARWDHP